MFLLALLDHNLKDNEYRSAFVSASAILGVDNIRGWKDLLIYTPTMSAIITVAKILVLYQAKKIREERVVDIIKQDGFSREDAKD